MTKLQLLCIGILLKIVCLPNLISANDTIFLNKNWTLSTDDAELLRDVRVPGYVPLELERAGILPPLFSPGFEEAAKEASLKVWTYETTFEADSSLLKNQLIHLVCAGLDTYADVYLNDIRLGSSSNMFIPFTATIRHSIKQGTNRLKIVLHPALTQADKSWKIRGDTLPGGPRVMSRKAQYMFGWDWAPEIPAAGIWQDVYLLCGEKTISRIESLGCMPDDTYQRALIEGSLSIQTTAPAFYLLRLFANNELLSEESLKLSTGSNLVSIKGTINNPQLWWTKPLGEPFLYDIRVELLDEHDGLIASLHKKTGVRKIRLHTDQDAHGNSFYFSVNDKPVFMKGANWIPFHFFPSEQDESGYSELLQMASDAHFNMLRVWGGGFYEKDRFYELCDSLGILVWQDFMFACGMYPADKSMINNIEKEAISQLNRLNHHPSIAVWCGNNEVSEGWERWGWKTGRSKKNIRKITKEYQAIFKKLLPELVQKHSPQTPYWESSPMLGRGDPRYKTMGDAHDWFVWHDGYPFEHFLDNIPRFMSEYGFQSYPDISTIIPYHPVDGHAAPEAEFLDSYQKHPRGNALISEYIARDFPTPSGTEELIYLSQLTQGYGISRAAWAHRAAAPYCMGSLYWQYNDCWPGVSWSSVDFNYQPKALYHLIKKAYEPASVQIRLLGDRLSLTLINDFPETEEIIWECYSVNGQERHLLASGQTAIPGTSVFSSEIPFEDSIDNESNLAYLLRYHHSDQQWKEVPIFQTGFKDWQLSTETLPMAIECFGSACTLTIETEHPIAGMKISSTHPGIKWEDNFIDMLPGFPRALRCTPLSNMSAEDFVNSVRMMYLIKKKKQK